MARTWGGEGDDGGVGGRSESDPQRAHVGGGHGAYLPGGEGEDGGMGGRSGGAGERICWCKSTAWDCMDLLMGAYYASMRGITSGLM